MTSGKKLKLDFSAARTKSYQSFNAIYNKICNSSEQVITNLVNTYCNSTLLYGLESFNFNTTDLKKLDMPQFRGYAKIFKTFDKATINWCMFYLHSWPASYEYTKRKIQYLNKIATSNNLILLKSYSYVGRQELLNICNKLNLDPTESMCNWTLRKTLWDKFCIELAWTFYYFSFIYVVFSNLELNKDYISFGSFNIYSK